MPKQARREGRIVSVFRKEMDLLHQKIAGRNELPGWSSPGGVRIVDPDASAVGVESLSQIVSVAEIIIDECV